VAIRFGIRPAAIVRSSVNSSASGAVTVGSNPVTGSGLTTTFWSSISAFRNGAFRLRGFCASRSLTRSVVVPFAAVFSRITRHN
jgi:hypothetical protein